MIAGISYWRFYFRLFPGSIKGPQIVEFLKALKAQIKRKLLIVWDGLGVHKSKLVREYVESLKGHVQIEFLPAYAPELNPTEYIWGTPEATRAGQPVREGLRRAQPVRTQPVALDAAAPEFDSSVLEAG